MASPFLSHYSWTLGFKTMCLNPHSNTFLNCRKSTQCSLSFWESAGNCFFKISGIVYYKMKSESLYFYPIHQVFLYNLGVMEVGQNKNKILLLGYQDWHIEYKIQYVWNCRDMALLSTWVKGQKISEHKIVVEWPELMRHK